MATRGLSFLAAVVCVTMVCFAEDLRVSEPAIRRGVVKNQGFLPFADAPIKYRSQDLNDPIAKLQKRLDRGEVALHYESQWGYLKAVLNALQIPVSSQALVFSKTSFQFPEITPATPRALYYNDDVYVGRVHNGKFLEFVSFDPVQGAIFYVMDEHQVERPRFERAEVDCVQCHVATSTRGVPGVLLRSVYVRASGYPAAAARSFVTGQESPLNQRWGGWYVTARQGAQGTMANVIISDPKYPEQLDRNHDANLPSLTGRLNMEPYLSASSDIVALMVLAHQTQMHNLITQTNYKTRLALYADASRNDQTATPSENISGAEREKFEEPAEELVRYLLFTNEAPLTGLVVGTSSFAQEFAARGPRDIRGRSLRDFDLQTRIFKYPCSYLIYSEDFNALPKPAKEYIYRRLFEVLSGRDQSPEYGSLSSGARQAILEILVATKADLPQNWKDFVRYTNQFNGARASVAAANGKQ